MQKAPLAVHHRSACSGVKALRNTSAVKRQAAKPWLAFRSLDPFRALREPDRKRRDEERPFRSNKEPGTNQNDCLTGNAPHKSVSHIDQAAAGREPRLSRGCAPLGLAARRQRRAGSATVRPAYPLVRSRVDAAY